MFQYIVSNVSNASTVSGQHVSGRSCVLRGNSRTSPLRTGSQSVLWAKPVPLVDVSSNCRTGSEVSLGLRKTET